VTAIYFIDGRGEMRMAHQIDFELLAQAAQADEAMRLLFARICNETNLSQRRRMIAAAMEAVSAVPEFRVSVSLVATK
jgi:hypothetical protein